MKLRKNKNTDRFSKKTNLSDDKSHRSAATVYQNMSICNIKTIDDNSLKTSEDPYRDFKQLSSRIDTPNDSPSKKVFETPNLRDNVFIPFEVKIKEYQKHTSTLDDKNVFKTVYTLKHKVN